MHLVYQRNGQQDCYDKYIFVRIINSELQDRIEELEDRLHQQELMTASIVHEIRTPLNCSIQMQEMLASFLDENLIETYLEPSVISSKLQLSLVNDLLDSA
jgi:signal transduction histidine kinase